ncbi:MAG TPA: T9SS type A sorting domain-containing protein, partial [Bacteroidota bacterium]|nr:T9SS type A sorting domain-containing protein [Bacteroidota bacterium]
TTAMTSRQQTFTGSVLEITYPDSVVWNGSEFLYPLIFNSDGDWEVDICGDVPQGYHIVGDPCVQLFLASETKVIFFDVVDFMSPEPTLKLRGHVKHNGKTKQFDADIPGLRKAKGHDKNNGPSVSGQAEQLLSSGVPSSYALHEAYPNPFNPSTTIRYDLSQDDYVKLKIFDVTGREIAVLVDGFQQGGQYMVQFNANGLPSGIYLYQISTGKFTQAKKLVLTK